MACRKKQTLHRVRGVSTWIIVPALLIIFLGCGEKPKQQPPPPPAVTVAQPMQRVVTDYLELTGNTQAIYTVQLVARVAGYLEKVFSRMGKSSKKASPSFSSSKIPTKPTFSRPRRRFYCKKPNWTMPKSNWIDIPICYRKRPPPKRTWTTGDINGIPPGPTCRRRKPSETWPSSI